MNHMLTCPRVSNIGQMPYNYQIWWIGTIRGNYQNSLLVYYFVYVLATFKVVGGWLLTCDTGPLGVQAARSRTQYPTRS